MVKKNLTEVIAQALEMYCEQLGQQVEEEMKAVKNNNTSFSKEFEEKMQKIMKEYKQKR